MTTPSVARMPPRIQTPLGHAVPPFAGHSAEHAVTVHLPTWQTSLDFIDRKPELMKSFQNMYPRMMLHASVKKLNATINEKLGSPGRTCLVFTSPKAPKECLDFVTSPKRGETVMEATDLTFKIVDIQRRFWVVFFPVAKWPALQPYWMNAGIGISSRLAEEALLHIGSIKEATPGSSEVPTLATAAHALVQGRIASLLNRAVTRPTEVSASDVFLYSTGVGAIYNVHRYLQLEQDPTETTILFGFAFLATAYTLDDFGPSYRFFGSADCDELERFAKTEKQEGRRIRAVWAEIPANPLLFAPDLSKLRHLANLYGFLLIMDDTVGSFCNIDVLGSHGADIVVTSLTKSFNGYSDVMAGSAVLNPCASRYQELKKTFDAAYQNELFAGDAEVLESNSRDYLTRSAILNSNASALVQFFAERAAKQGSPLVQVYYPSRNPTRANYEACMRPKTENFTPGYGCLLSVEFKTVNQTRAFYDALSTEIHIGPHLGAHVTLALVYVKLLYAAKLDEVNEFGLNERQVRISAGLEPIEELIPIFEAALEAAEQASE